MSEALKSNIQKNLELYGISIAELERRAGLKTCAVRNILDGRSKNPNIDTLRAIAQEFDQKIDELLEPENATSQQFEHNTDLYGFDPLLFMKAYNEILNKVKQFSLKITIDEMLDYIKQVYEYSIECDLKLIDERFVKFVLRQKIKAS